MRIKPETRVIGIDDSPLLSKDILVVGAVMRGGTWLDGVVSTYVERDGMDATEKISALVAGTKHYGQIRVVMLNGVTFGGFNVADIEALNQETGLPVIVVMRKLPDMKNIRRALDNLSEPDRRYRSILKAGEPTEVRIDWKGAPVHIQCKGIEKDDAARIVIETAVHSRVPEPLRVAHLIATGVVLGESSKRP
jgi:endonuclease V-like protein UPF0215 family